MDPWARKKRPTSVSRCLGAIVAALLLCLASGGSAAAEVTNSSPFTDYRQAVADQYGTAPGGPGEQPGGGAGPQQAANQPVAPEQTVGSVGDGGGGKSLPFTGLDLLSLVLLGMLLLALGMLLAAGARARRRLVRLRS
jgi:hypothetical protein